jgi:hypothetical protein
MFPLANQKQLDGLQNGEMCRQQLGFIAISFCYLKQAHSGHHKGITFYGQEVEWDDDFLYFGKRLI